MRAREQVADACAHGSVLPEVDGEGCDAQAGALEQRDRAGDVEGGGDQQHVRRSAVVAGDAVLSLVFGVANGEMGFVQINAEPGVVVFIDGDAVGTTSEAMGGLLVMDVPAGERLLLLEREGYEPQAFEILVEAGRVSVHDVGQFAPPLQLLVAGDRASVALRRLTGTLIVQTLPVESLVDLPGLGLREQVKARDLWQVEHVPVGRYALTVTALGREAQVDVEVLDRHETRVFVSLASDSPVVRSEQRPIPTHAVERVGPQPLRSNQNRQRVEIHGRGFRPGATGHGAVADTQAGPALTWSLGEVCAEA